MTSKCWSVSFLTLTFGFVFLLQPMAAALICRIWLNDVVIKITYDNFALFTVLALNEIQFAFS